MKRRTVSSVLRYLVLAIVGSALLLLAFDSALADGLSQGYLTTDTQLKPGMVVALTADSNTSKPVVERATIDGANRIIGIAVGATDNSIVISPGKQQVYVQTSGNTHGYVSDLNGNVKKGDILTISPLRGIMMRADSGSSTAVGVALDDASGQSAENYTVSTASGSKETAVTEIGVNLDHKGLPKPASQSSPIVALGRAVSGHDTGEIRVIIALVIFLLILIAEGGIIYGSVSSAITAMGRNPLAGKQIRHELIRVLLVALFVFAIGLGTIYALLWV